MSTKLTPHKAFDQIESWLGTSPNNLIKIVDKESAVAVSYEDKVSQTRKMLFSNDVIKGQYKSVIDLFTKLHDKGYKELVIAFKKNNGTSTLNVGKPIGITLSENTMLRDASDNGAVSHSTAPLQSINHSNQNMSTQNYNNQMGGLGAAANAAGLGFADLVELKKTEGLYKVLVEQYDDLKSRHKKDDAEWTIKRLSLESEIADLKRKLDTAKDRQELAIAKKDLEQKPAVNPEIWDKLAGALPEIAGMVVEAKTGVKSKKAEDVALGGAANLSDTKKQLIEYVSSNEVDDKVANFMINIVYELSTNQDFSNDLQQLINTHQNGTTD